MRGASRRGSDAVGVSLQNFAWPRAVLATLRHPSLPWFERFAPSVEVNVAAIREVRNAGARDRLSLVGQFAAHVAFLQFAGIGGVEFDAAEWAVCRRRSSDCRLVRIAARASADAPSALQAIQEFADAIDAPPLDVLRSSWARAESVYAEVFRRLRTDGAADLRWLRRCAAGEILSPGPEALLAMWNSGGPFRAESAEALTAYAALDDCARLMLIGSEFPIQRYAALAAIDPSLVGSALTPAAVADRLMELCATKRHVLAIVGDLDEHSKHVVDIMSNGRHDADSAVPARWLVLSTRIAAERAIEERLATATDARSSAEELVMSEAFEGYLERGTLPVDDSAFAATPEPRRSYVAALALLGTSIPGNLVRDFLRQFLFEQPIAELVIDGATSIDGDNFVFASDAIREQCARHIPAASRPALCRSAASVADPVRAALLLLEAGDVADAVARLANAAWRDADEAVRTLGALPRNVLTPSLARVLGHALVDCGRYRDARDIAPLLEADDRELLLARCDRRTGDYTTALARLTRISTTSFDAQLLRGVLLRLTGAGDAAPKALAEIVAADDEQKIRLAYERALLCIDRGDPRCGADIPSDHYFGRRLSTYRALLENDFDLAAALATQSIAGARCAAERIDAYVDRIFASFSTGRWGETRAIALEALALVDEAQGDRAAAGVLFTLTFVEIDDGRWSAAAQHIRRLRDYYATTHDDRRLAEIDLLSAYLEFARARFDEARRLASTLLDRGEPMPQIREAAALILDEIDWIERRATALRSAGHSRNRELDDRHRLMCRRRGQASARFASPFMAALAEWEASPATPPPDPATRSEKLKLFRSALGVAREKVARDVAADLNIAMPEATRAHTSDDVDMLRIAASADYPYRADAFPLPWCHATRNRLGQWAQDGSRTFDSAELERIEAAPEPDWIRCSERELLFIDGCRRWPESSRDAVAAVFRTRGENQRLRRIVEQEETTAAKRDQRLDGVIGESHEMRAVFSLVERIGPRDVAVCVLGESGTGKELVGRAIHRASPRRQKTFTALNCAALPETLVESELFGHVRGAFTGADRDRAGVIETTDGGTLFLDEIGEMPLTVQAKLLRFLQDGEFRRVGDTVNRSADVRIVSATNRKLESAVEEGRFREDLYYRIRGVDVVLPPLRDRGGDVMLLAQHFLERERARHRAGPQAFAPEVETLLQSYAWPGNVRELQNTIRAAHAMAGDAREIDIEHLPERLRNARPARVAAGSYQDAVARFRRDLIEKSLAAASGNQNRAAAMLKISRQALAYQIRELGIMIGKTPPRAGV